MMPAASERPDWVPAGLEGLSQREPRFATIEPLAGPLPWRVRPRGFGGLIRSILGQQISNLAADAIWRRYSALPGALEPAGLLALGDEDFRAAGLSRPKVAHLRSLAQAALRGELRLDALGGMTDAEAVAHLAAQRGLGPWTAQVHLLFAEGRQDIFPHGDIALAAGFAHLTGLPARPTPRELTLTAEAWSPWRSLAARLLWHYWRNATGRPVGEAD